MGLETYTEIYFSVTVNLVEKNTVFILDVMVKHPKTTWYEFFMLHDIDNNWYFEHGSIIKSGGKSLKILEEWNFLG